MKSNPVTLIGDAFEQKYKWAGGAVGGLGHVYAAPSNHRRILKINPNNGVTEFLGQQTGKEKLIGYEIEGNSKYSGGVRASNGCIYFAPNSAMKVLKYNPRANTIQYIGSAYKSSGKWDDETIGKWCGGTQGSDGCLYFAPLEKSQILRVDPSNNNDSTLLVGKHLGSNNKHKFSGCVASKDNKTIYFIPLDYNRLMEFDVATQACKFVDVGRLHPEQTQKWTGGVLGPDGCIYGIPGNANKILKYDPQSKRATLVGAYLGDHPYKYAGGVLGSDNCIYCIPYNANRVLRYNIVDETTTLVGGSFPGTRKWSGGVACANGTIIGIPFNHPRILKIDPKPKIDFIALAEESMVVTRETLMLVSDKPNLLQEFLQRQKDTREFFRKKLEAEFFRKKIESSVVIDLASDSECENIPDNISSGKKRRFC